MGREHPGDGGVGMRLAFGGDKLADEWVHLPNTNPVFAGRSPLAYMLAGGLIAMQTVRKLLAADLLLAHR